MISGEEIGEADSAAMAAEVLVVEGRSSAVQATMNSDSLKCSVRLAQNAANRVRYLFAQLATGQSIVRIVSRAKAAQQAERIHSRILRLMLRQEISILFLEQSQIATMA